MDRVTAHINTLATLKSTLVDDSIRAIQDSDDFPVFLSNILNDKGHFAHAACTRFLDALRTELESASLDIRQQVAGSLNDYCIWRFNGDRDLSKTSAVNRLAEVIAEHAIQQVFFDLSPVLDPSPLSDSRVFSFIPRLRKSFYTKDQLLLLEDTSDIQFTPYGIHAGDYFIQYHRFLRRGFGSRFNMDFLSRLIRFTRQHPESTVRVAIDHSRIAPAREMRQIMERDAWRGRPFQRTDLDDPRAVGITIRRTPDRSFERVLDDLDCLYVKWSAKDRLKTVEIEELHVGRRAKDYVLNRYVHSIRDIENAEFIHLDGACKCYPAHEYGNRLPRTGEPCKAPTRPIKIKTFRIDGCIPLEEWTDLITFWFRGNPLVPEYFGDQVALKF